MTEEQLREIARAEAEAAIADRTIPAYPMYFAPSADALVTYDWFIDARNAASRRIDELEQRIAQLERPWWRRWLSR